LFVKLADTSLKERQPTYFADTKWKTWYRIGGLAFLIEGITYLIITVTSSMIGVAPGNNLQYISALAAHARAANFTYYVILLADLALIPGAYALYHAFKNINRNWMLVATALIWIYVVVDLLTFVPTAISLVALSQQAQTASVLATEHSLLSIVPLSQFFGWVEPPIAFAIWIAVLRRANVGRLARIFGFFLVPMSILGGTSFLVLTSTYLQSLQLPALAIYGIFFLGLTGVMFKLHTKRASTLQSRIPQQEVIRDKESLALFFTNIELAI
jgi:hypothetical protein